MEQISLTGGHTCNQDTLTKVLYCKLSTPFDFISALVLTRHILDLTLRVTELLQGPAKDVTDSPCLIIFLKSLIKSKRKNVDQFHNNYYKTVLEIARKVKVDEIKTRTAERNRDNIPSESAPYYFKKVVAMPLLDCLITQLNERFDSGSVYLIVLLHIVAWLLFLQKWFLNGFQK